jgi:excisionase family DNA binding protein
VAAVLDAPREVRSATLSVYDTARLLGVSAPLIYRMISDKRLPALRVGRRVLVRRETVERLLGDPLPIDRDGEVVAS